jgi:hypothetical protein
MSATYVISLFGNVRTSWGELVENTIYTIDSTISGDAEFTSLANLGYISVQTTSGAAQTILNSYQTLAQRILSGERSFTQPLVNSPAHTATLHNAVAAVAAAQTAYTNAVNTATVLAAQVTAQGGSTTLTAAAAAAVTAEATALSTLTTAQGTLATAQAAVVSVPYSSAPTPLPIAIA